jgi:hypothetical protein
LSPLAEDVLFGSIESFSFVRRPDIVVWNSAGVMYLEPISSKTLIQLTKPPTARAEAVSFYKKGRRRYGVRKESAEAMMVGGSISHYLGLHF